MEKFQNFYKPIAGNLTAKKKLLVAKRIEHHYWKLVFLKKVIKPLAKNFIISLGSTSATPVAD